MDKEPTLYMLMGLPASGKSTYAKKLSEETGAKVFSSDEYRERFGFQNESKEDNNKMFQLLHEDIKSNLQSGESAIYDATNINRGKRINFLNQVKCRKVCIIMATTYEDCVARNIIRENPVPLEVAGRMYKNWCPPMYQEGWDDIIINYDGTLPSMQAVYDEEPIDWMTYNQENSHHSLSLGQHMARAYLHMVALNADSGLKLAALFHDSGKTDVASHYNGKGEWTKDVHYFNHMQVGSYKNMFYMRHLNDVAKILDVCNLTWWHMHPYLSWKQSEKAREKDRKFLGEEFCNRVMLLHDADVNAH